MKISSAMTKTLVACAMGAALVSFTASAQTDDKMDGKEKCYGVAKAGKNDCKGGAVACAGHSTKDGEGFVVVPKGLCERLTGGSTSEPAAAPAAAPAKQ